MCLWMRPSEPGPERPLLMPSSLVTLCSLSLYFLFSLLLWVLFRLGTWFSLPPPPPLSLSLSLFLSFFLSRDSFSV
ncbi:mCG148414 [Mus musculus]|nr:mCG148414 [Mus musculus]